MTERIITIPINQIRVHPDNPRLAAVADEELVESIRAHGLIDPPLCAPETGGDPHGDWVVLLDGHRRFDGCQKAGLTEITVRVRDDLVTTAQQVEVMAITGLQKELLSPVEEARAYEQLQLLGMDEAAIAKSTGFSKRRVKERLKLTWLTDTAQAKVHAGEATLLDVAAFDEFADDPAAIEVLEEDLGTDNYRHTVMRLKARKKRAADYAAIVEGFEEQGVKPTDSDAGGFWSLTTWKWHNTPYAAPDAHDGCLGYIDCGVESYQEPYLVCTDPDRHTIDTSDTDDDAEQAEREAAMEALRAEQAAAQERREAASAARTEWLVDHFTALFPVKGNAKLADALGGLLPAALSDGTMSELLSGDRDLAVIEAKTPTIRTWAENRRVVLEAALELTLATPAQILTALGRFLGHWYADILDQTYVEDEDLPVVLWAWDWLAASGYPMSTVDTERHIELAARAADTDDDQDDDS